MQSALEKLWSSNIVLKPAEVSEMIELLARKSADVYVRYCSNAQYQDRILQQLM
jgi:hypothetical protein